MLFARIPELVGTWGQAPVAEGSSKASRPVTRAAASTSKATVPQAPVTPVASPPPFAPLTPPQLLRRREAGEAGGGFGSAPSALTKAQSRHVQAYCTVPEVPVKCFDSQDDACYTLKFSEDGSILVGMPPISWLMEKAC